MYHDGRLEWVQTNRSGKDRVRPIGTRVEQLVEEALRGTRSKLAEQLASAIACAVDDDFKAHCRLCTAQHGVLIVHVDNPVLVYPMRLRWWSVLRESLSRITDRCRIGGIVFRCGSAGVRVKHA